MEHENSYEEQLQQVEMTIEAAKPTIERYEAFRRLKDNKDFIAIFEKDYFVEESSRLVLMLAEPGMQAPEEQASILKSINAIGELRQYLITVSHMGKRAIEETGSCEEAREEILIEQANSEE